ncbi:MAG: hypothetical protein J2O46_03535 [Nocardioides sp.]|nr:hypothetical protein [Nocardioides sp.]
MGRIVGLVIAVVMVLAGGFVALAGMGYVGAHADTSTGWTVSGSLLAGLGIALAITIAQRRP